LKKEFFMSVEGEANTREFMTLPGKRHGLEFRLRGYFVRYKVWGLRLPPVREVEYIILPKRFVWTAPRGFNHASSKARRTIRCRSMGSVVGVVTICGGGMHI
jgi:hypothetical protein